MEVNNKYIRFDWAVKRMLRDKANFAVLEGLITVLTGEVVKIEDVDRIHLLHLVIFLTNVYMFCDGFRYAV